MAVESKKTRGRQKIEMKRIENEEERLITFSKRRSGIYKKASELVTLTGAQVAFVVFSPGGKPFSFAHPSVEIVTNRFLGREPSPTEATYPLIEAHRQHRISELNQQHNELNKILDEEKEKGKQLKMRMIDARTKGWWDTPIEELSLQDLIKMEDNYEKLQEKLHKKIREKSNGASCSSSQPPPLATFIDPIAQLDNPFGFNNMNPNEDNMIHSFPPHDQFDYGRN